MEVPPPIFTEAVRMGFWQDHDYSSPYNTNLTLKITHAQALLAFIVVLVTFAANRSWKIFRFILHGTIPSHRHHQVILRNSETASAGLLASLGLLWSRGGLAVYWLPAFMLVHWLGFVGLGVLTSKLATGNLVLSAVTETCGLWVPNKVDGDFADLSFLFEPGKNNTAQGLSLLQHQELRINLTLNAENYVGNCYDPEAPGTLECNRLRTRALGHDVVPVPCPFDVGYCDMPDGMAYAFDSGNISFSDLGLNWERAKEYFVRRRNVCSVLPEEPFRVSLEDLFAWYEARNMSDVVDEAYLQANPRYVFYTITTNSGTPQELVTNATVRPREYYEEFGVRVDEAFYDVSRQQHQALPPIRPRGEYALAELELVHLDGMNIMSMLPSSDPLFWFDRPSTREEEEFSYSIPHYRMSRPLNTLACIQAIQYCSSAPNYCTNWLGVSGISSDLSSTHYTSLGAPPDTDANRFLKLVLFLAESTSMARNLAERGQSILQAKRFMYGDKVVKIPDHQWSVEVGHWFSAALAMLQLGVYNTIQSSPGLNREYVRNALQDVPEFGRLCGTVKFRSQKHMTLSVFGLGIVVGAVVLFTALGFADAAVGWCAWRWVRRWQGDEMLELLEKAEGRNGAPWGQESRFMLSAISYQSVPVSEDNVQPAVPRS